MLKSYYSAFSSSNLRLFSPGHFILPRDELPGGLPLPQNQERGVNLPHLRVHNVDSLQRDLRELVRSAQGQNVSILTSPGHLPSRNQRTLQAAVNHSRVLRRFLDHHSLRLLLPVHHGELSHRRALGEVHHLGLD